MSQHWRLSAILVLSAAIVTRAGDETGTTVSETDAIAARLMAAVRVIEKEHFDPPPRQELVHRLIQGIAAQLKSPDLVERNGNLPSRLDDTGCEAMLAGFLRTIIDERPADGAGQTLAPVEAAALSHLSGSLTFSNTIPVKAINDVEAAALSHLLGSLAGTNYRQSREEHAINEQFAANRYVGTGIALSVDNKANVPQLMTVVPNGPAYEAGAKDGDLLLEIDGRSTARMDIGEAVDRIRGPAGTDVTFLLRQPQEEQERRLTITRGVVPFKHTKVEQHDTSVVIKINQLTASIVQELRDIDDDLLDSIEEVVLVLPSSHPGDLHQAVLLADALLDGGRIGRARTRSGVREFEAAGDCLFAGRSLSVRVSQGTSGTLEWIAAALQDNGRAKIVGQRTAGEPFITEAFDVPETDWVLHLTCGVLERGDGRPLLATEKLLPIDLTKVVPVRLPDGTVTSLTYKLPDDAHDGGVVPDEVIDTEPPQEITVPVPAPLTRADVIRTVKHFFWDQSDSE